MSSTRSRSAATDDADTVQASEDVKLAQVSDPSSSTLPVEDAAAIDADEDADEHAGSGESSGANGPRSRSKKGGASRKRGRQLTYASRTRQSKASQSAEAEAVEDGQLDGTELPVENNAGTVKREELDDEDAEEGVLDEDASTADSSERDKNARQRSVSGLKELAGLGLQTLGDGEEEPLMPRRSRRSGNAPGEGGKKGAKEEDGVDEDSANQTPDGLVDQSIASDVAGAVGQDPPASVAKVEPETVDEDAAAAATMTQNDEAEVHASVPEEQVITAVDDQENGDEGVTRCLCGSADENVGLMIQCETCKCWQHCICMGMRTEEECPDVYFCEQCRPELHVPLLRLLGVLPARGARKNGGKAHGSSSRNGSKDSSKELKDAKEAVLTLAKENERRRREGREPVTGWSIAQHQEQEAQQQLAEEQLLQSSHGHAGQSPQAQTHAQALVGRGSSASSSHKRQQTDPNRIQRSNSRDEIPVPKSPPKRRSTMNSRESVYGWEPLPPGLLNEDEVWDEVANEEREESSRKRKRLGREDESGSATHTHSNVSSNDSTLKRRRTSPGARAIGGEHEGGHQEEDEEEEEEEATAASHLSQRGAPQRGARQARESDRPKHPNQYTKRAAAAAAAAAANNGAGESTSPGPSPHKTRADGVRRSARDTGASSRTGTPAPGEYSSGRRGDGTWALPEHLSHLAFLLPPGSGPEPLKVSIPTAKGGPKGAGASGATSGALRDAKSERIIKASPQPFNMINLSEATTKIKYPGKRMTMGEMRKRVRNILEFVSRLQIESVERERRMRLLGIVRDQPSSTEPSSGTSPATSESKEGQNQDEQATAVAQAAATAALEKEASSADGVAPGATSADGQPDDKKADDNADANVTQTAKVEGEDVSMQEATATVDATDGAAPASTDAKEKEADEKEAEAPPAGPDTEMATSEAEPEAAAKAATDLPAAVDASQASNLPSRFATFSSMTTMSSMTLVDELTRELLAFQTRFGTGTSLAFSNAVGYQ